MAFRLHEPETNLVPSELMSIAIQRDYFSAFNRLILIKILQRHLCFGISARSNYTWTFPSDFSLSHRSVSLISLSLPLHGIGISASLWIWQLCFYRMDFQSVCTLCIHCIQMVETTKARGAQEFNSIEWNGKAALASHRSTYATKISLALVTLLTVLLLYHLDQSCVSRSLVVGDFRKHLNLFQFEWFRTHRRRKPI